MARVSRGPRYYDSKGGWYTTLGGETVLLVKGPKKQTMDVAQEKYDAEVAARRVETDGDRSTVWQVMNAYLVDLDNRVRNSENAPALYTMHEGVIAPFVAEVGLRRVRDLRP